MRRLRRNDASGGRLVPLSTDFVAQYFRKWRLSKFWGRAAWARSSRRSRRSWIVWLRSRLFAGNGQRPCVCRALYARSEDSGEVNHPSIVGVHDFGEIDLSAASANSGEPVRGTLFYFIMEYVDGANLRQLMQSGQISPDMGWVWFSRCATRCSYAHGEGVVHRDIKPENIMLDTKGRVKIADFGLAKLAERIGQRLDAHGNSSSHGDSSIHGS